MGKTRNEMREYNEMPVSLIAKVHNSPAAQPRARICIAITAERKASGTNVIVRGIVQRNETVPDTCLPFSQTFYARYEVLNALSAVFHAGVCLSRIICSIYLLGYQSKVYVGAYYLSFPKALVALSFALVYVAVPTVGCLSCSLTICVATGAG